MRTLGTVGSVGFAFVIAIALGWWFGATLDRWFGTKPWLMLILLPFGFAAGVMNVMRLSQSKQAEDLMGGKAGSEPAPPVIDDDED